MERTVVGTGAPPLPAFDAAGAVVRLVRNTERGEAPPLSLLRDCLSYISRLDVSATGGDALLWMLPPVLRSARDQLTRANDERQTLEVEVAGLKSKVEALDLNVEGQKLWLRTAEEEVRERMRQQRREIGGLWQKASHLEVELKDVEAEADALQRQIDEGLGSEREAWAKEREALEDEAAALSNDLLKLGTGPDMEERIRQAEEALAAAALKVEQLKPSVLKQEELRRKVADRSYQIDTLSREIEIFEQKKLEKKKKPKGKKK